MVDMVEIVEMVEMVEKVGWRERAREEGKVNETWLMITVQLHIMYYHNHMALQPQWRRGNAVYRVQKCAEVGSEVVVQLLLACIPRRSLSSSAQIGILSAYTQASRSRRKG